MTRVFKLLLITVCFLITFSQPQASKSNFDITNQNYSVPKDIDVVPYRVMNYLQSKNSETVKIWVFYRDKGFNDKSGFSQKASSVHFSDKVLKRRKKVGIEEVLFIDLPVSKNYISQIEKLGAKHRRDSKWLNASSFEVSIESLNDIASLDFVKSIRPVAEFKREKNDLELLEEDTNSSYDSKTQSPFSTSLLSYGSAFVQLNQINVPKVHDKGYSGAGVTLCLTDTGYRKSHSAFAATYADNRVISEYDFIFDDSNTANEAGDVSSQWSHGTLIWSVSAGNLPGQIYGPAYNANILLAKTEDVRSETQVEEDNWIAALEWADSLGVDVISTSLTYTDWYTIEDFDGNTAPITLAANTCPSLGIVLCVAMGNSGPGGLTLGPPADAFGMLSVGNVTSTGVIASSSSRGPTFDGRTKPEVCAMGTSTFSASSSGDNNFTTASGTSLSTPLIAGAACLLIEARPDFTPLHIRQALMETADNADNPDNNYGWGIIDVDAALGWGAEINSDIQTGEAPITVNFDGTSPLTVTSWLWDFGDGFTSTDQNPSHTYTDRGLYDVSLTVNTDAGIITNYKSSYIVALGDTMIFVEDSVFAGDHAKISVTLSNSQPLSEIHVPFRFFDSPKITFDSVTLGARTSYFEGLSALSLDSWNKKYTYRLIADNGAGSPDLPSGSGEIMQIHFSVDEWELGGQTFIVDSFTTPFAVELQSPSLNYSPVFESGAVKTINVLRGDYTYDFRIDISDLVALVHFMFTSGPEPQANQMADLNDDRVIDVADLVYLVDFMFTNGPPPVSP